MNVRCIAGLGTLVLVVGCGGKADVNGTVTYKNKTVKMGTVLVAASDGNVATAQIQEDGSYSVANLAPGPVKMSVSSPDPKTVKVAVRKKNEPPPPPQGSPNWFAIPEKYGDYDKAELKFDLKSGSNVQNLDLK